MRRQSEMWSREGTETLKETLRQTSKDLRRTTLVYALQKSDVDNIQDRNPERNAAADFKGPEADCLRVRAAEKYRRLSL